MRYVCVFALICALASCATSPDLQLSGYRGVLLEPPRVEFAEGWYKQTHAYDRAPPRAIENDEVQRIAREAAASLQDSLAQAFARQGFEVATAAAPGVLRISPAVTELYINVPPNSSPWRTQTFTRNAGQATLSLELRDALSGASLGRLEEKVVAEQMGRVALADNVTSRFWFDALFQRWSARTAAELAEARDRPS